MIASGTTLLDYVAFKLVGGIVHGIIIVTDVFLMELKHSIGSWFKVSN